MAFGSDKAKDAGSLMGGQHGLTLTPASVCHENAAS